ncbi:DUF1508 domain-containing protein [Flavobacterium mekongense]|uniref:DUF1508 domain-containing protein n=1 Tax=Flavobacterium mekongense TaxID=3379707 RepID=UPI003999AF53
MGTFVISKRLSDEYKFEFVSRKGKPIFTSANFELRFECEEAIEQFKAAIEEFTFLRFKTAKGKCFFKVMKHDAVFAISRKYSTELMMQKGIDEIVKYASQAEILDFSSGDAIFSEI